VEPVVPGPGGDNKGEIHSKVLFDFTKLDERFDFVDVLFK
jgi:hypothetical protein